MATKKTPPYTNHMVCETLVPKQRCFRCFQYRDGRVEEVCHEHLPKYRMAQEKAMEVLRAMVSVSGQWPLVYVVRSHMNSRSAEPEVYPGFRFQFEYPAKGVARYIQSSGNDWAWFDERIA